MLVSIKYITINMSKIVRVLVKPLLHDKYEHLIIIDVDAPYVANRLMDTKPVFSYITPKIRQLIEDDVSYRELLGVCGHEQYYSTKFKGNRKTYVVDGITYDVKFVF